MEGLTNKQFWLDYWENKEDLNVKVHENYLFSDIFNKLAKQKKLKSAVEIGGFPGYYSIFLKKWLNIDASLVDYVIHNKKQEQLLRYNGLEKSDVKVIEADIFSFEPKQKYNLVCSFGFIEHFESPIEIIRIHEKWLSSQGVIFINMPNFSGFNGWINKSFDRQNYDKHNIKIMDVKWLTKQMQEAGYKNFKIEYYGGFSMWIENKKQKSLLFKAIFKITWLILKIIFKLIPIQTKTFSPYIHIFIYT